MIGSDSKVIQHQEDRLKRHKQQLKQKLTEIFQIDSPDLDFGVYRIMNQKRDEILRFMDDDLINMVDTEFGKYDADIRNQLLEDLNTLEQTIHETYGESALGDSGLKPQYRESLKGKELHEKWLKLQDKVEESSMSDLQKAEIFAHLEEFFSRYYKDGDFLSLRRYSANEKYAIPYNGEEVMLHWANKDQYYIKTDRHLKTHGFDVGTYRVLFEVVHAEGESNGNGKGRYFVLANDDSVTYDDETNLLTIRFSYKPLSDEELIHQYPAGASRQKPNHEDIVTGLVAQILDYEIIPKGLADALKANERENDSKPRLFKHINSFTKENTSDFFIHKNLGDFLRQELDFYIKNEVFRLDDLGTENEVSVERYVKRAKVIKSIGHRIIEFLAQLEEFQKKLWEKKKFVIRSGYCMTIDHVPKEFYSEILANKQQLDEWQKLYEIGDKKEQSTIFDTKTDVDFLQNHPFLVVDTAFFDEEFMDRLLERLQNPDGTSVEDLDENVGGLMIKSENWQALNLIKDRYQKSVKSVYIDPPYNTGNDEFIYRDNYQHSSWISMIYHRIHLCKILLQNDGVLFSSIDDHEVHNLRILLNDLFGEKNNELYVWDVREDGNMPKTARNTVRKEHEYILSAFNDKNAINFRKYQEMKYGTNDDWGNPDNDPRGDWMSGNISRNQIQTTTGKKYYSITTPTGRIYTRNWSLDLDEFEALRNDNRIYFANNGDGVPRKKIFANEPIDIIQSSLFEKLSSSQSGKQTIIDILGHCELNHPKPLPLIERLIRISTCKNDKIIDFFAGSGTTAHAVLNVNITDDLSIKYILIEMGDYFDTLTKPRIQKVVYSSNWKEGKPQDTDGQSHIFKYMELEQYEDTLDNIEFLDSDGQIQATIFGMKDYMLNYFLDFETKESACRLNIDKLTTPFAYKLRIRRGTGFEHLPVDDDGFREVTVDLVETFNYLLGLHVKRRIVRQNNGLTYRVVHGSLPDGGTATIVWRNSPKNPVGQEKALEADEAFINSNILKEFPNTGTLYVNGHCFATKATPIEPEFKKRMGA